MVGGKNGGRKTGGVGWTIKGREMVGKDEGDFMVEKMSDVLEMVGVK